jgi:casein kinase I homolog HRR25
LDIYGPSLEQLLQYCDGKFTLKTVLLIADQLVDRIAWLHSKNLVYNDIDSENFLVGLGQKADKIFIVDLGNCRKFVDDENNHYFISKEVNPVKNNSRFKSIHGHIGKSNFMSNCRNLKERRSLIFGLFISIFTQGRTTLGSDK